MKNNRFAFIKVLFMIFIFYTSAYSCGCVDSGNASAGAKNINSNFDKTDNKLSESFKNLNKLLKKSVSDEEENLKFLKQTKSIYKNRFLYMKKIIFELEKRKGIK